MVGTALDAKGGVASVLGAWLAAGFFQRHRVRYVASNGKALGLGAIGAALRCYGVCVWLLLAGQVRVVHVHHSSFVSFWRKTPLFVLTMVFRKPLIVSLHGGAYQQFYLDMPAPARWWQRRVMRYACRYLVLTPSWKEWALSIEPRARAVVVPNFAPSFPVEPPTYPETEEEQYLLFLGRIEPLKGVPELIEALAQSRARGALWKLVLGGLGAVEEAEKMARRLGVPADGVQCIGWVNQTRKDQLLRQCSALVLPSHAENMPVVLLEAFAYARPVVATRVGGVTDMLEHECEGLLVAPQNVGQLGDALVQLWSMGRDARQAMGLAARRRSELHYEQRVVLERLGTVYEACAIKP